MGKVVGIGPFGLKPNADALANAVAVRQQVIEVVAHCINLQPVIGCKRQ
jgi:hypothetical protein